jgi:hypothetical protein
MSTWRVDSYGYPNPFTSSHAKRSWDFFESFSTNRSYAAVKSLWESHPTQPVDAHTVESRKSAFEQFGLLYVLTSTDRVVLTPGGKQLLAAASARDQREFAWIGLNLLLRYPLRGKTGRRPRDLDHQGSDLLPYWFFHAAMLELDGLSQHEMFRVVGQIFKRADGPGAIDRVRAGRTNPSTIAQLQDPTGGRSGAVYNALNQVLVAGGLNHMVLTSSMEPSTYSPGTNENFWRYRGGFREIVELALGAGTSLPSGCASGVRLTARMPAARGFPDEEAYFEYAGAAVTPLPEALAASLVAPAPSVQYGGESVRLLTAGKHFTRVDADHIVGPVQSLCVLSLERRVLVSDDLAVTHMVENKELLGGDRVQVRLRRARPVLDLAYVQSLFEDGGASV